MNIIDFGLSVSLKEKLAQINDSSNGVARYHWSYPFESFFLNRDIYENFSKLSSDKKMEYYQSILQKIKDESTDESIAIKSFFSFVMDQNTNSNVFIQHMYDFYQTLVIEMTMKNYQMFIKKSISSIDVYGFGITLLYILKKTKKLLNDQLYKELYILGINMVSAHLAERTTANYALSQYENILTENGIMSKYNISFANHKIVKGEQVPQNIKTSIESIKIDDLLIPTDKLNKNAISVDISYKEPISVKSLQQRKKGKKTYKKRLPKRSKTPKKQT